MQPNGHGHRMESVTIRRAAVVDADKVRYRVYSSPTEFVAVIAESALMAVKVAGIKNPHKVMRDMPTDGIAIEAKKMAERDDSLVGATFLLQKGEAPPRQLHVEVAPMTADAVKGFVPMGIADLRSKGGARARILSPDMLHQIIEDHAKAVAAAPPPAAPPVEPPVAEAEPVAVAPAEPELSQMEKVVKMAEEVLPVTAPPAEAPAADPGAELLPEEVEKLLNQ